MKHSIDSLKFDEYRSARRWLVAYSGGVDSHVLLYLLAQLREQSAQALPELLAIHVNHQLQQPAADWAQHCQQVCEQLAIPLITETVSIQRAGGDSLEALARDARYQVFEKHLRAGDVLLLAHHLDDQVETGLMRLLRGSGALGLGAMAKQRKFASGILWRPLLEIPRQAIEACAEAAGLQWVEDPSNADCGFARNYLRRQVLPAVEQRWPEYRQSVARALQLSRQASELNRELAAIDCLQLGADPQAQALPLAKMPGLGEARQLNLLRYWIELHGFPLPSYAQLQALLHELVYAAEDADPLIQWGGVEARRFRGQLYLLSPLAEFDGGRDYLWNPGEVLELPGNGRVSCEFVQGRGVRNAQALTVTYRQGGERCQPAGRSGSQTLKKLFQEYSVPTWLRDRVPLLYIDNELVAVANYWVCAAHLAGPDEAGMNIHWTLP